MEASERNHDLALLFLKNQDLSNFTPTKIAEIYAKARKEVAEALANL